jgi:transposase
VRLDTSNQLDLFSTRAGAEEPDQAKVSDSTTTYSEAHSSGVNFVNLDPNEIMLNQVGLCDHLKQVGQQTPLEVRKLLGDMDWQAFEQVYKPGGRPPYGPRSMMGIILLGIMNGVSSLRQLEEFARVNLGCLWVSGGILPDHSIIGRFIQRHETELTEAFFDQLTRSVLKVTKSSCKTVAGDGTIIEAASSRFNVVKAEALARAIEKAEDDCTDSDDQKSQEKLECLNQARQQLDARQEKRRKKGKKADGLTINKQEPDAVVQPQKDKKRFAASYKPSVLANEKRVIVALEVDASSETSVVGKMLDQASGHGEVKDVLLDAGYFNQTVIDATQSREIELLCPEGRSYGEDWNKQSNKRYLKSQFEYDAQQDAYRCPAGQLLVAVRRCKQTNINQAFTEYGTDACSQCASREACTSSVRGRRVKRYACDDDKDALRKKMQQEAVRERYKKRQAMVEPVFSYLRQKQGLNRFRRKGLKAVRLEFALHAMAYNLGRVVALRKGKGYAYNLLILIAVLGRFEFTALISGGAGKFRQKLKSAMFGHFIANRVAIS